ncbi:PAS domain-containing protein [Rhodovibrio salinarum]|uniref:PAS domain-containing protein n=2 Tax=Rhodovibrio salinarum TaxID=1087 RepID=UPI0004B502FE|nr:PAS domain-containing protein [Rhodovibrio salinarum]
MRTIPDLKMDGLAFFERWWQRARGRRRLPPVSAIDPSSFPKALPTIFLLDGETVETLRVRLAGTFYRELYDREVTGEYLASLIPFAERPDIYDEFDACLRKGRPAYHDGTVTWRGHGAKLAYRRILLPFGESGKVRRIMGFAEFKMDT